MSLVKCLLALICLSNLTFASKIKLKSMALTELSSIAQASTAYNYPELKTCDAMHGAGEILIPNQDDAQEKLINNLFQFELQNKKFWKKKYSLELKREKLVTLDEFTRVTSFSDLFYIVDGIYCFSKLGRDAYSHKPRLDIFKVLNKYEKNLRAYIYYEDGFESETQNGNSTRLLSIYFLDAKTSEVYALKGIEVF